MFCEGELPHFAYIAKSPWPQVDFFGPFYALTCHVRPLYGLIMTLKTS